MPQLEIFHKNANKIVKTVIYIFITGVIGMSFSTAGWVVAQVIDRPEVLSKYQTKLEADKREIRIYKELSIYTNHMKEYKEDMCKKMDKMEKSIEKKFDKVESLLRNLRYINGNTVDNKSGKYVQNED